MKEVGEFGSKQRNAIVQTDCKGPCVGSIQSISIAVVGCHEMKGFGALKTFEKTHLIWHNPSFWQ